MNGKIIMEREEAERTAAYMCDHVCRFAADPHITERRLRAECERCPMNRLVVVKEEGE